MIDPLARYLSGLTVTQGRGAGDGQPVCMEDKGGYGSGVWQLARIRHEGF